MNHLIHNLDRWTQLFPWSVALEIRKAHNSCKTVHWKHSSERSLSAARLEKGDLNDESATKNGKSITLYLHRKGFNDSPSFNSAITISCQNTSQPSWPFYRTGPGTQGFRPSFVKRKLFSGSWEDSLHGTTSIYEAMAFLCNFMKQEDLRTLPVMLTDDALLHYSLHMKTLCGLQGCHNKLHMCHRNPDDPSITLTKLHTMRIAEGLQNRLHHSKLSMAWTFVAKLISFKNQLDHNYHNDKFSTGRRMTIIDRPSIQVTLRDLIPRTAQQLTNRIANRLPENQL